METIKTPAPLLGKGEHAVLKIVVDNERKQEGSTSDEEVTLTLDSLARAGAQAMIKAALLAEVEVYIQQHSNERDAQGHRLVVRNGYHKPRQVTTGAGPIEVKAPRVDDKRVNDTGEKMQFTSAILPRYSRRSPKVDEVLPVLYLRGLSTGDFRPALESLLGKEASGLSPTTITRMTKRWEEEYRFFQNRDLSQKHYVYVWVDGVHFNIRLEEDRLCALVMIGVLPDGKKELVAIVDGYRESTESWLSLLRDLRRRGMAAPALAVGDGALGFWKAVQEVYPQTQEQRCGVHKLVNILDKLPNRLQPKARRMYHEIINSATRKDAEEQVEAFVQEFGAKYPKAVECLVKDQTKLLAFYDFPAEHWIHLRSTNIIESIFSTVRLRTYKTRGAGSRAAGLVMAFKLIEASGRRWRAIRSKELIKLVDEGYTFIDGTLVNEHKENCAA
jgi:putative transposase